MTCWSPRRSPRPGPSRGTGASCPTSTSFSAAPRWPPFDVYSTLIACLMGSLVLVWSALRISTPERRLGRFDGVARFLFSTWMAWALWLTHQPLLWLFLVPEFAWGVVQWWPVRAAPRG